MGWELHEGGDVPNAVRVANTGLGHRDHVPQHPQHLGNLRPLSYQPKFLPQGWDGGNF